jgi:hypothetical protein
MRNILISLMLMLFFANSKAKAIDYSPNGAAGLNLVYNGGVDDYFFPVNLPWTVSFLGSNYGTVYVGSNGYITFSSGNNTYSGFSPANPAGPHISIYPADRILTKLYYAQINAGTAEAKFVIRVEGYDYSNAAIVHIYEVHFYSGQSYYDIFFVDAPSSGNQNGGTTAVSNGSSYVLTFSSTESTGIRINSNGTLYVETPPIGGGGSYTSNITNSQQTNITANLGRTTSLSNGNEIYIEQVGNSNTTTITQSGNYNKVTGTTNQTATISGNSNNTTIRQNSGTGKNLIDLNVSGTGNNTLNLNQGYGTDGTISSNQLGNNYQKIDVQGSYNTITTQQTRTVGTVGNYMEQSVSGNYNSITSTQSGDSKLLFNSITGNNNTVSTTQSGTGAQHYIDLTLNGNSNSATVNQSGNTQNKATIVINNLGGSAGVDLTQTGGQTYNITTNCVTLGGCGTTTVRQGQ